MSSEQLICSQPISAEKPSCSRFSTQLPRLGSLPAQKGAGRPGTAAKWGWRRRSTIQASVSCSFLLAQWRLAPVAQHPSWPLPGTIYVLLACVLLPAAQAALQGRLPQPVGSLHLPSCILSTWRSYGYGYGHSHAVHCPLSILSILTEYGSDFLVDWDY